MNRPNILLITSDQHTARVAGCYGDAVVDTPNLDALAAQGARFESFYCNNPICCPSRMSFLTGRYSFRCEVIDNNSILDSRLPTLAHMAVRGGYHAALAGKMHFYGPDQRHGFLERLVGEVGTQALFCGADKPEAGLANLGNCSRPEPLQFTGPGQNKLVAYDRDITDQTVAWLKQWSTQDQAPPFFFTVGYLLPHCPFIAPDDLYAKYEGRVQAPRYTQEQLAALHPNHRDFRRFIELDAIPKENEDRAVTAYYALCDQLDQNIGAVIGALKDNGLWDNTIVIYYSDHGEMLGRHGRWHKESFFEDSARVPLIVRDPRHPEPAIIHTPHSLVDLMPTLCEWMSVEPPPGIDGESLVPFLERRATEPKPVKVDCYTFWSQEQHGLSSNRMVRQGPWKLCYYGAYDSFELYNLDEDPEEMINRADDPACREIVDTLKPELFTDGWTRDTGEEVRENLEACGIRTNIKNYRDALKESLNAYPRPVDCPDYWPGSHTEPDTLSHA